MAASVETENVIFDALLDKLVIQFRKISDDDGNTIDIEFHKAKMRHGTNDEVVLNRKQGAPNAPNGIFPIGTVYKYRKNPFCICFDIGGAYFEICFD